MAGSNILGLGLAALTGGLGAGLLGGSGAMGALGNIGMSAVQNSNTPIGRALSLYGTAKGIGDMASKIGGGTAMPNASKGLQMPEFGSSLATPNPTLASMGDNSPISRALAMKQTDPTYAIQEGLDALNHPEIMGTPLAQASIQPLLMAKHFGGMR